MTSCIVSCSDTSFRREVMCSLIWAEDTSGTTVKASLGATCRMQKFLPLTSLMLMTARCMCGRRLSLIKSLVVVLLPGLAVRPCWCVPVHASPPLPTTRRPALCTEMSATINSREREKRQGMKTFSLFSPHTEILPFVERRKTVRGDPPPATSLKSMLSRRPPSPTCQSSCPPVTSSCATLCCLWPSFLVEYSVRATTSPLPVSTTTAPSLVTTLDTPPSRLERLATSLGWITVRSPLIWPSWPALSPHVKTPSDVQ